MCSFMWRDANYSKVPVQLLEETLRGLYEDGENKFIATRWGQSLLKSFLNSITFKILPHNLLNFLFHGRLKANYKYVTIEMQIQNDFDPIVYA
jgi:hypothetical protein